MNLCALKLFLENEYHLPILKLADLCLILLIISLEQLPWKHLSSKPISNIFHYYNTYACMCDMLLQSCLTLCNPVDCSPSGSSVCGILQARTLEWVSMSSPGDLPDSGIKSTSLMSPALAVLFH